MNKVIAFVDGFNLYHSISESHSQYKWLDYNALANAFIAKSKEHLSKVYYFSAFAVWNPEKMARHKNYIKALELAGVEVVLGKFKKVRKKCRALCKKRYTTFEEKETDVNIALYMLELAVREKYDKALLFSGDSDLIPAVKAVQRIAPQKQIQVVIPFGRSAQDLKNACDSSSKIKLKHLQKSQFPSEILDNGRCIVKRPPSWY